MPQLRIRDYFQSTTWPVSYTSTTKRTGERETYFLPYAGIVQTGEYKQGTLSDNTLLICELEKIQSSLKSVTPNPGRWYGLDGIEFEQLELYWEFLCFCHLVWGEDISETEPLLYEYMVKNCTHSSDNVRDTCWTFIDGLICNREVGTLRLAHVQFDADELTMEICADDLHEAFMTQLFLHIYKGKKGRDGVDIAVCRSCGRLYARVRKNSRLCFSCSSSTERSRSCRLRKKEEVEKRATQEDNP